MSFLTNINLLHSALNASSMRQNVISNNIANAETPGFKSKSVVFEDILKQKLNNQTNFVGNRSDSRHVIIGNSSGIPQPFAVENRGTTMQNNENNVDLDEQMSSLSKNALWYNTLTSQLSSEFQKLSIAIKGRV
ncbi:flagellar basal body rod protein FlgB [Bacillus sp. EB01]|uniref:flagellar basal body rod protein FlgB n=1 Tax=Bacillus sp. EB01 TaxID=1347086 RepID=UPI003FA47DB9